MDQIVETFKIEILIHDQTQTEQFFRLIPIPIRILGLDTIRMIDQEVHHTIDKEVIPTIETEAIRISEINDITIDHEIIQITDQITKDLIITKNKNRSRDNSKKGYQNITIDKDTTLNHLIEITHVIQILKTKIEAKHQNIKNK